MCKGIFFVLTQIVSASPSPSEIVPGAFVLFSWIRIRFFGGSDRIRFLFMDALRYVYGLVQHSDIASGNLLMESN